MAETSNLIPLCRCCHKNGVFKSLFYDFIYDNEIENYSQMFYDTFGIFLVSSEYDKIYTICDECIEKLRCSTEFKIGVLACEKSIECDPSMRNDVTFKIEKMWSYSCSEKVGPLIADNTKVKREETNNDEVSGINVNKVLNEEPNEDVRIEKSGNELDETFCESEGPTIADTNVKSEETANDEESTGINKILDEESNKDVRIEEGGNKSDVTVSESGVKRRENKCNICSKIFRFKGTLENHVRSHDGHKCQFCAEILSNKRELANHIKSKHFVDGKYCCIACDATFLEVQKLNHHIKTHFRHRCDMCNKDFKYKSELRKHETVHNDERKFKCSICNNLFIKLHSLKVHMETHARGKPYECQDCGQIFTTRRNLMWHSQKVHIDVKKYSCRYCDKGFFWKNRLVAHERVHTGEKPYVCDKCNKSFRSKDDLISHIRVHVENKPYICSVCDNRFKTRKTLNSHMVAHTKMKHFQCSICNETFVHKCHLSIHMNVHDKAKYECDICQKTFKYKRDIRRHMLGHFSFN